MSSLKKFNCILLIDDDEPTNFIHQLVIDEAQFTRHIRVFDYAEDALAYLAHCASPDEKNEYYEYPDLILLDINMPRVNAWEFAEEFRKHLNAFKKPAPIIVLTTSINPDDRERAKKIPEICGFYVKPLTGKILEDIRAIFLE